MRTKRESLILLSIQSGQPSVGDSSYWFIPVLFRDADKKFIPTPVQSATHYRVDTEEGYERLYAREALAWARKGAVACRASGEVRELLFRPAPTQEPGGSK